MSDVFKSLQTQLTIVEEASVLRRSDVQSLFKDDLKKIESHVAQIEQKVKDVERIVEQEKLEILKIEDMIAQAHKQRLLLRNKDTEFTIPAGVMRTIEETPQCPGAVTEEELEEISPYMKGRLTVSRINSALEELTSHANKNADMIVAAKKNKTSGIDRKHALWLLHSVSRNPSVRNRIHVVLESDLRRGKYLKMDNTSKSILTILRHLGRISECRVQADGQTHVVYVCLYL